MECDIAFLNKEKFYLHMKKKHVKYLCNICNKTLKKKQQLIDHNASSHNKNVSKKNQFDCNKCDYKGSLLDELLKHKDVVHSTQQTFKCDICNYESDNSGSLTNHKTRKHKPIF